MGREGKGRKGRGRQGRGRGGKGGEGKGGKGWHPQYFIAPQFQFSRNMPALNVSQYRRQVVLKIFQNVRKWLQSL